MVVLQQRCRMCIRTPQLGLWISCEYADSPLYSNAANDMAFKQAMPHMHRQGPEFPSIGPVRALHAL